MSHSSFWDFRKSSGGGEIEMDKMANISIETSQQYQKIHTFESFFTSLKNISRNHVFSWDIMNTSIWFQKPVYLNKNWWGKSISFTAEIFFLYVYPLFHYWSAGTAEGGEKQNKKAASLTWLKPNANFFFIVVFTSGRHNGTLKQGERILLFIQRMGPFKAASA